jgi:hypothetical protein
MKSPAVAGHCFLHSFKDSRLKLTNVPIVCCCLVRGCRVLELDMRIYWCFRRFYLVLPGAGADGGAFERRCDGVGAGGSAVDGCADCFFLKLKDKTYSIKHLRG